MDRPGLQTSPFGTGSVWARTLASVACRSCGSAAQRPTGWHSISTASERRRCRALVAAGTPERVRKRRLHCVARLQSPSTAQAMSHRRAASHGRSAVGAGGSWRPPRRTPDAALGFGNCRQPCGLLASAPPSPAFTARNGAPAGGQAAAPARSGATGLRTAEAARVKSRCGGHASAARGLTSSGR